MASLVWGQCSNPGCAAADEEAEVQFLRCSQCRAAEYCGKACQKQDWPAHKAACKAAAEAERIAMAASTPPERVSATRAPRDTPPDGGSAHGHSIVDIDLGKLLFDARGDADAAALALRLIVFDAVMPPGASPAAHGSTIFCHDMINDTRDAPVKNDQELFAGFYDVEQASRLPSPISRVCFRFRGTARCGNDFPRRVFEILQDAHAHQQAPNDVAVVYVNKKDPRISRNLCANGDGMPMFNGTHVDPRVRKLTWDTHTLRPKR